MSARVYIDLTVHSDRTEDAEVGYLTGRGTTPAERILARELVKGITAELRAAKRDREKRERGES